MLADGTAHFTITVNPTSAISSRILSFSNIYALNAWLLLAPSALCCDWSLGSVPLVTSFSDTKNIWSLLLYAGLLALVIHVLQSKRCAYEYIFSACKILIDIFYSFFLSFCALKPKYMATKRIILLNSLPQKLSWSGDGSCSCGASIFSSLRNHLQSWLCDRWEVCLNCGYMLPFSIVTIQ